ncbi:hypothetical protein LAG90_12805 [Marinilongibacter aquaticus]|uniref:leucine-rich repeat domain-containing protein n=1 Tax=Marinilongibacter aquaticus TaxID=2975157 RepID=UPI0021BD8369|nr:hypothetical protein [Marinilongibacter aquaticus]UBM57692.1 hypothetical protein LAG90_12805 [Marinilongibacter aquaticus]
MKLFALFLFVALGFLGCKKKGADDPNPILPEGNFEIEASVNNRNKLTVVWSNPENLSGSLNYEVYLGGEKLGETTENYFTTDIEENRFVNGRVTATDTDGNTETHVFLAEGEGRDLVYIPDPNFEWYLVHEEIDSDGEINGQMNREDAKGIIVLYLWGTETGEPEIGNLQGLEVFVDLQTLVIGYHKDLKIVDLKSLGDLNYLRVIGCSSLKELNLASNIDLSYFDCSDSGMTSLDLSEFPNLKILECSGNQLTSLDLSKNPNLEDLICWDNKLTNLDVSYNLNLETLYCSRNHLGSLDVSRNAKLTRLDVRKNPIKTICVDDVEAAKNNGNWNKPETAEYVQCE